MRMRKGAPNLHVKLAADSCLNAVSTVTLFIPALFWPHAAVDHAAPDAPALQKLLARGNRTVARCEDEQAWLCEQFGVERQVDWPVAPIALAGAGVDPGQDFWLCADPVHLQVNRDQLILLAPESLSITAAESVALCATLNNHFVSAQLTFLAPQAQRWFLKTTQPARIRTRSLAAVVGRDVDALLPSGQDQLAWHRIFNEVQMVLHAHPVNEEREQRGELPINSVWFSGGGILQSARAPYQCVMGGSDLMQGLAKLAGVPCKAPVPPVDAFESQDILVELAAPAAASMLLDPAAWKIALESLEADWFAPLAQGLRQGPLTQVIIATLANGQSYQWRVNRTHLWRFWRSAAPLASAGQ
jgi:hypothetical protein